MQVSDGQIYMIEPKKYFKGIDSNVLIIKSDVIHSIIHTNWV